MFHQVPKIRIKYLVDENDCDQCGGAYAEGAVVFLNDEEWFRLTPVAHCFGGQSWTTEEVHQEILKRLGYKVEMADN